MGSVGAAKSPRGGNVTYTVETYGPTGMLMSQSGLTQGEVESFTRGLRQENSADEGVFTYINRRGSRRFIIREEAEYKRR